MNSSERLHSILSPPRRDAPAVLQHSLISPPLSPPFSSPPEIPRNNSNNMNIIISNNNNHASGAEGLKKWAIQYEKNKNTQDIYGSLCLSAIQQRSRHIEEEAGTRPWALKYRDLRANKRPSKVFGQSLPHTVAADLPLYTPDPLNPSSTPVLIDFALIPRIVRHLVNILNQKLDTEGLFRVAGNQTAMSHLCNEFDCYFEVDLKDYDGHCLSGVLKQYLRDLPQPLIPYDKYEAYFRVQGDEIVARAMLFGNLINELPSHNKALLLYLLEFFIRVTELSSVNKMTPNNLAIVLGPTILPSLNKDPLQVLSHNMASVQLVEDLITHGPVIFEYLSHLATNRPAEHVQ